jgi:hypothetical protein
MVLTSAATLSWFEQIDTAFPMAVITACEPLALSAAAQQFLEMTVATHTS